MKALQILGPNNAVLCDAPEPVAGPGQVLLKVLAVTTCPHWDMHILGGEPMFPGVPIEYPYTLGQPGHEACGEIAAVGEGVEGLHVGQRVCAWRDPGHDVPGCYAQYVVKEVNDVIPVPETLAPEACAALELAMCVSAHLLLALKLDAIAGQRVGVFGLGPAGLVAVQLARDAGAAEVVGFDLMASRRELAAHLGADYVIDPASDEAARFPMRYQEGALHTAFDCAGVASAVHYALDRTNALCVLFAVQRQPYTFAPQHWGGLILAGAQMHTREAAEYAAARLASGGLDLGALVSRTMPLEDYAAGVAMLRAQEALKIAFLPQD